MPYAAPRRGDVPHSTQAERQLIGAALLDCVGPHLSPFGPDRYESLGALSAADFFDPAHRLIWQSVEALWAAGTVVGLVTVADALARAGTIDEVDRLVAPEHAESYLTGCWKEAWYLTGVSALCRIVHDYAERRRTIERAGQLAQEAYNGGTKDWRDGYGKEL